MRELIESWPTRSPRRGWPGRWPVLSTGWYWRRLMRSRISRIWRAGRGRIIPRVCRLLLLRGLIITVRAGPRRLVQRRWRRRRARVHPTIRGLCWLRIIIIPSRKGWICHSRVRRLILSINWRRRRRTGRWSLGWHGRAWRVCHPRVRGLVVTITLSQWGRIRIRCRRTS